MTPQTVTPQLRITDHRKSLPFYVDGLGFHVDWEHRFEPGFPLFAQVSRGGQALFLTEHAGDCKVGGAAYIVVADVDALYREIVAHGVVPTEAPEDAPWGGREMLVTDPDGNRLRFATAAAPAARAHRAQPLLAVSDVERSSAWYQRLLGCRSAHGGGNYERLESEGLLILQLHRFEVEHEHGPIGDPEDRPYGNGVLVWFEVDDFDAAAARAREMGAEIVRPRHRNPASGPGGPSHWELWVRDPDGYTVVLASPDWSAASGA